MNKYTEEHLAILDDLLHSQHEFSPDRLVRYECKHGKLNDQEADKVFLKKFNAILDLDENSAFKIHRPFERIDMDYVFLLQVTSRESLEKTRDQVKNMLNIEDLSIKNQAKEKCHTLLKDNAFKGSQKDLMTKLCDGDKHLIGKLRESLHYNKNTLAFSRLRTDINKKLKNELKTNVFIESDRKYWWISVSKVGNP